MPQVLEVVAAIVGTIATFLGGVAASGLVDFFSKLLRETARETFPVRRTTHDSAPQKQPGLEELGLELRSTPRWNRAKAQVLTRIGEARALRLAQERAARRARWATNSLVFGQYVIGGAMATSFLQRSLSPNVIGIFGVLVVVASLLKQHYHPETNAQSAWQKASQLSVLVRQSEDRLVVIETTGDGHTDDPALVLELLERISAETSRIMSTPDLPAPKTEVPKRKR